MFYNIIHASLSATFDPSTWQKIVVCIICNKDYSDITVLVYRE